MTTVQPSGESVCIIRLSHRMYLLIRFRKSTPRQNRKLIVYYYHLEYDVDGFAGELTFQNLLIHIVCEIKDQHGLVPRPPGAELGQTGSGALSRTTRVPCSYERPPLLGPYSRPMARDMVVLGGGGGLS